VSKEWTTGEVQSAQHYGDDELAAGVASKLSGSGQHQDDLAHSQHDHHSGSAGEDADMADGEGDDGMDDDMLDKISSSPSIDDGGYSIPLNWPQRCDSLTRSFRSQSLSQACYRSSSPFIETSEHFPSRVSLESGEEVLVQEQAGFPLNHHHGEYLDDTGNRQPEEARKFHDDRITDDISPLGLAFMDPNIEGYDEDYELDPQSEVVFAHINELFGEVEMEHVEDDSELEALMTIPYLSSEDDDDDDFDLSFSADSRFVDSGWSGECLQESEDIDFEFVYALHTFVATVEGQANATKGDTMVLLDDSNSYWWLVRVVKDSSIGGYP
jgi:hypothetical protein